MDGRTIGVVPAVFALGVLVPAPSDAQVRGAEVPRTSWGAPDLQGVWDFRSLTPMERPEGHRQLDRRRALFSPAGFGLRPLQR